MRICLSTCPPDRAEELATLLLTERLAACVNVLGPVRSHYRWKGEIARDDEALLVIKTTDEGVERLMARLVEAHPYETPEFVVVPVEGGWPPYLAWVAAEVLGLGP